MQEVENGLIPRLHFITHSHEDVSIYRLVKEYCRGYGRLIQLRMKNAAQEEIRTIGEEIVREIDDYNGFFIVNDHVDVASELKADGVHLGNTDTSPAEARKILGEHSLIGGTAGSLERILEIADQGGYIRVGPFKQTSTKSQLSPLLGLRGIDQIMNECFKRGIHVPVIAVGGITLEDIPALMETGIYGVAVSGAIINADDIVEHTMQLVSAVNKYNKAGEKRLKRFNYENRTRSPKYM